QQQPQRWEESVGGPRVLQPLASSLVGGLLGLRGRRRDRLGRRGGRLVLGPYGREPFPLALPVLPRVQLVPGDPAIVGVGLVDDRHHLGGLIGRGRLVDRRAVTSTASPSTASPSTASPRTAVAGEGLTAGRGIGPR